MTSEKKNKYRIEKDSLGDVKVPSEKLWGAQTQRSLQNFRIGNDLIPPEFIKAFAMQKKAAAVSNIAINQLDSKIGSKIIKVCDLIIKGNMLDQFPLSVWQTGSGTQTNMNLNEVIANKANQELGKPLGEYEPVHPNDHCNMSQSSNDSFPTAMHISIVLETNEKLFPSINNMINTLKKKINHFEKIIKIGRTHLQDATPITLGQEFTGYLGQIENAKKRISESINYLLYLAQGGTAVGTGLNAPNKFIAGFIKALQMISGLTFKESKNKFELLSSHESIVHFSNSLNTLIIACYKIANDIRLLASGPRCGIGELIIPSNEPGSSIMPGKVNPTQCEALSQVCLHIMGLNFSNSVAGTQGHFQLNANKTLLMFNTLKSIELITDAIDSFSTNCLEGIVANKEVIQKNLNNSLMLVTALNPKIGYEKAAKVAKLAYKENISLKDATVKLGYLTIEEFEKIVDVKKMI